MTWRDKLEIGLKEDAPFRKDNLPEGQVRGPEIPNGPGRSPEILEARGDHTSVDNHVEPSPRIPPATRENDLRSRIASGAMAGLIGGVPFGLMMQTMSVPTPGGGQLPMMAMVAMVVGSSSIAIGWLYHLLNSVIIGALFAWVFGSRVHALVSGLGWGAAWGLVWWVAGGLVLMPLSLGMPPFAPLMLEPMRLVAMGSLMGHALFGLVLGAAYEAIVPLTTRPRHPHLTLPDVELRRVNWTKRP